MATRFNIIAMYLPIFVLFTLSGVSGKSIVILFLFVCLEFDVISFQMLKKHTQWTAEQQYFDKKTKQMHFIFPIAKPQKR